MDCTLYNHSLGAALVLMLFFAIYFLVARVPEKPIFAGYLCSRRLMGLAILVLAANYSVHLFLGLRQEDPDAAILMNLSTYFLDYWVFSSAFMVLLDRFYLTRRRIIRKTLHWLLFTVLASLVFAVFPDGLWQKVGLLLMALWLLVYGIHLSRMVILTYHRAVRLFDDTHSEDIGAYIRWMSIFTWWALIYGVSCGLLTFLPDEYVFLWVLSSIPFYIYLYCSYMNYLLFYEQVESILEKAPAEETEAQKEESLSAANDTPAYHITIEKNMKGWLEGNGFTTPGLTIEDLAMTLGTNRTYLSSYIKTTYKMSFREWIASHRIEYAKQLLGKTPKMTVAEVSEASGFLSLSYFTKIFTEKEGTSPSKWRK